MERPNTEPLTILAVTGIFLFLLAAGFPEIFQGEHPAAAVTVVPAVQTVPEPASEVADGDTLRRAGTGHDTVSDLYAGLEAFYKAVARVQTDHTVLHIAYFGDSMIEGDLVTQPLRRSMQRRFGGSGIGFVPVTTPLPGFRTTIRQSFNDDWKVFSFLHPGKDAGVSPGISGFVYLSEEGAETRYESVPAVGLFHRADILFGGQNEFTARVATDTVSRLISLVPDPHAAVSEYSMTPDTAFSVFELSVTSKKPAVLYGVNFENGPGVYVDNYAFRGNSGLPLQKVPPEIISGFNNRLRNKLLIIHYGLNVFTPGVGDYHWYEMAMVNVIRHVKESSPGCSILVISMPDRCALISGEYYTPAELPAFIELQHRVATAEHVAFFNLYNAMGGANSMKRWVEGQPKLAGDDYTHPNGAGASRIASMVYDFLIRGYDRYLQHPDSLIALQTSKPLL